MMEPLASFMIALLLGIIASLMGAGGGFFIVPYLLFTTGLSPHHIAGTSLAVVLMSSLSSTLAYGAQKRIDFKLSAIVLLGMMPGSLVGAWLNQSVTHGQYTLIFGFVLILSAVSLFKDKKFTIPSLPPRPMPVHRRMIEHDGKVIEYAFGLRRTILLGFMIGVIAKIIGIGGGVLLVPIMIICFRIHPKYMVATSCLVTFLSSIVAFSFFALKSQVAYGLALPLGIGVMIGAQIGAKLSWRLKSERQTKIISVLILAIGLGMVLKNII
ncbi:sulfite exporter TauE/SafE family protein [Candidatus Altiarchaeota archaeon]